MDDISPFDPCQPVRLIINDDWPRTDEDEPGAKEKMRVIDIVGRYPLPSQSQHLEERGPDAAALVQTELEARCEPGVA